MSKTTRNTHDDNEKNRVKINRHNQNRNDAKWDRAALNARDVERHHWEGCSKESIKILERTLERGSYCLRMIMRLGLS